MKTGLSRVMGAALALAALSAGAAPLSYNEAIDGDLHPFPTTSMSLGVGTNTVTGSVASGSSGRFPTDFDSFSFELAAGATVTSISMSFTLENDGASFPEAIWVLGSAFQRVDFSGASPVDLFAAQLPWTASALEISANSNACGCVQGQSWRANYVLSLEVTDPQTVPEPGTPALLLAAAGGAALLGRRRNRRPLQAA